MVIGYITIPTIPSTINLGDKWVGCGKGPWILGSTVTSLRLNHPKHSGDYLVAITASDEVTEGVIMRHEQEWWEWVLCTYSNPRGLLLSCLSQHLHALCAIGFLKITLCHFVTHSVILPFFYFYPYYTNPVSCSPFAVVSLLIPCYKVITPPF